MDFQTLTRRQLQALSKKNKIPANLTNVAMADSLRALDNVEGIEELLLELSEQSNTETPIAPRTGCRSSARRIPIKEDVFSFQIMTRTRARRVANIIVGDDKENGTLDVPETPAGQSYRRRVPVRSNTEKQLDIEMEHEKQEQSRQGEEKTGVPKTPRATTVHRATRTTRSSVRMGMEAGNQKVETSTKKVYSTRRNARLLEKKMMELSLIGDDDENESTNNPVASGDQVQLLDEEGTESRPIDEDVPINVETLVVPSEGAEELEEDIKESKGDEDVLNKFQISESSSSHTLDVQHEQSGGVEDDVQVVVDTEENVHVSETESYEISHHSLNVVEPYFDVLEEDIQERKGDEDILSKTSIQVTVVQLEEIEEVKEAEEDAHVCEMESYDVSDQTLNVDPDFEEFKEDIQESKRDVDIVSKILDVQPEETEVVEETEEGEDDVQEIKGTEEFDDDVQEIEETEEVEDDVQKVRETEEVKDDVQKVNETKAVEDDVQEVKETADEVEDDFQQEIEETEEFKDVVQLENEETEENVQQEIEDVVQEVKETEEVENVVQEVKETEEVEDVVQEVKETKEVEDDVEEGKETEEVEDVVQEVNETEEVEDILQEVEEIEEDNNVSEMEGYEVFVQTLNAETDVEEAKDNVLQDGTKEVVEVQESKEDVLCKIENCDVSNQNWNVQANGVEEVEDDVESNKPHEIETNNITEEENKAEDESKTNEEFRVSMAQLEDKFKKALRLNDEIIEKGFDDLVTVERDDEKMFDNGSSFENQMEKRPSKSLPLVSSHLTTGLVASVVSPFKKPTAISGQERFQILDVHEEEEKNENKNGLDLTTTTTTEVVAVKKNEEAVMGKDYISCSLRQLKKEFKQIASVNNKGKKNAASEQDVNATRPALQVLSENQVVGAATRLETMGN